MKLSGFYGDPDGEEIVMDISINGEKMGQIALSGNTWSSDWIDLSLLTPGILEVEVTGCDQSGKCTSIFQNVDNSEVMQELAPNKELGDSESGNNIPFLSAQQVVITLMIAVAVKTRGGKK